MSVGQWMASAMACAPTSVSQQPRLPQWHSRPAGLKRQVAHLAGVAPGALQPDAPGDDAGTDADVAGDVDEVVHPDGHPADVLGERAQVGVVGDRHRHVEAERGQDDAAEGDVVPLEVGGQADQAVAAAHEAGDADPDADQLRGVGDLLHDAADQSGDGGAHLPRLAVAAHRRLRPLQHASAQADAGHHRPVDPEVHRDDERTLLGDADPGRRAAGALARRALAGSTRSVMPSASSSLTSAAMVLRLSPMRPVSSAREI